MNNRKTIFDSLRLKMEEVGFQFETEQKPHLQNRKETELKFVHPQLIKKWKEEGYNASATKFYIKRAWMEQHHFQTEQSVNSTGNFRPESHSGHKLVQ